MKTYTELFRNAMMPVMAMTLPVLFALDARAGYPEGYYDSFNGKCGVELMRAVKAKAAGHKEVSYGTDTWNAFKDTDVRNINGVDCWWDMYANTALPISQGRPDSNVMNIEHSVANSWWGKTKNSAYKDLCHLNPSDSQANSRKGNYPLAELSNVSWTNGVTSVGSPKSGQGGGAGNCYEPADEYKGDFARVYMYMFTIYDDISWKSNTAWMYDTSSDLMFKTWARELLLRWSADDPVSDKERRRNDGIQKHQNNRNPFIDLPDLAEHIWGSKKNVPFSVEGNDPVDPPVVPDDPADPETDTYKWLPSTSSEMDAEWTIEDVQIPSGGTYVWSWKDYKGNYYLNASAYISGTAYAAESYAWSPVVSFKDVEKATLDFYQAARYQTTLRSLCGPVVKDVATGNITELEVPAWPSAGSWTFTNSGDIDLSEFTGKNVQIGFKYESDTSGADTWEINDVTLVLKRTPTGVGMPSAEEEDDSFLVEVWGNNILVPEGARIFDLNGREFNGTGLGSGVYIVVKPTFEKAVKVMIK